MADNNNEILINTRINVDIKDAERNLDRVDKEINKLTQQREIKINLSRDIEEQITKTEDRIRELKQKFEGVTKSNGQYVDNRGAFLPLQEYEQAEAELKKLEREHDSLIKKVEQAERAVSQLNGEIANKQGERTVYEQELSDLYKIQAERAKELSGRYEEINAIDTLTRKIELLKQERDALIQSGGDESKIIAKTEQIDKLSAQLERLKAQAASTPESIEKTTRAMERTANASEKTVSAVEKFGNRIAGLVKRVFVFSLITKGLRQVRTWFDKVLKSNDEARAAMGNLKGAVLTFVQPLVETVIPVITKILNILTALFYYAGKALSAIFGKSFSQMVNGAQSMYNATAGAANNIKQANKNAKELKRTLASFDTLEILQDPNENETELGDLANGVGGDSGITPKWNFADMINDEIKKFAFLTAMGLIVVGMILVFSGASIPVGLAMIVIGALALYGEIKEDWDYIKNLMRGQLGDAIAITGMVLIILGVLVIVAGKLGLGVGMIVAGAGMLAFYAYCNWDILKDKLQGAVGDALAMTGMVLIVIGVLALIGQQIPLGIGLIVAGASGLGLYAWANWDILKEKLQGPIGAALAIVSTALLVIGIILLCVPSANSALGIGLIAAGAVGLATTAVANWDRIAELLQGPIGLAMAIVSTALLVIGIILLCVPSASTGLGIGLIVAGAAGLGTTLAANWNAIAELLEGPIGTAVAIVSGALLVLGIIAMACGQIPLGCGLLVAGSMGLVASLTPNWENSPWKQAVDDMKSKNDELRQSLENLDKEYETNKGAAEINGEVAKDLYEKLKDLITGYDGSRESAEKIQGIVDELNQIVPGLSLTWDGLTNSLNLTDEAILSTIDSMIAQAKVAAAQDYYVELMKKEKEAQRNLTEASQEAMEVCQRHGISIDDLTKALDGGRMSVYALKDAYGLTQEETVELLEKVNNVTSALGNHKKATDDVTYAENEYEDAIKAAAKSSSKATEDFNKHANDIKSDTKDVGDQIEKTTSEAEQNIQGIKDKSTSTASTVKQDVQTVGATVKKESDDMEDNMTTSMENISDTAEKELGSNSTMTSAVKSGASEATNSWKGKESEFETNIAPIGNVFENMFGENGNAILKVVWGWYWIVGATNVGVGNVVKAINEAGIAEALENQFNFTSAMSTIRDFFYNLEWNFVATLNNICSYIEQASSNINQGLVEIVNNLNRVAKQASSMSNGQYYEDYGTFYGANVPRLSYPNYPAYAKGTVVPPNALHLALLGDNKKEPEVVSPVSTMKQAFKEALQEMGGMGGNVNVYLDGKQLSDAVSKWQSRQQRAFGL